MVEENKQGYYPTKIKNYSGSVDQLVDELVNLRFDAQEEFLQKLSIAYQNDARSKREENKTMIAGLLELSGAYIAEAKKYVHEALCKSNQYMNTSTK
jgi:hypothetical protein